MSPPLFAGLVDDDVGQLVELEVIERGAVVGRPLNAEVGPQMAVRAGGLREQLDAT